MSQVWEYQGANVREERKRNTMSQVWEYQGTNVKDEKKGIP